MRATSDDWALNAYVARPYPARGRSSRRRHQRREGRSSAGRLGSRRWCRRSAAGSSAVAVVLDVRAQRDAHLLRLHVLDRQLRRMADLILRDREGAPAVLGQGRVDGHVDAVAGRTDRRRGAARRRSPSPAAGRPARASYPGGTFTTLTAIGNARRRRARARNEQVPEAEDEQRARRSSRPSSRAAAPDRTPRRVVGGVSVAQEVVQHRLELRRARAACAACRCAPPRSRPRSSETTMHSASVRSASPSAALWRVPASRATAESRSTAATAPRSARSCPC